MKKEITRKAFLKTISAALLGAVWAKYTCFFASNAKKPSHSSRLKEAKYYRTSEHLAG